MKLGWAAGIGASLVLTSTAQARESYLACINETQVVVAPGQLYATPPQSRDTFVKDVYEAGMMIWLVPPNGTWVLDEETHTVRSPNGPTFQNAMFSETAIFGGFKTESGNEVDVSIDRLSGQLSYAFYERDGSGAAWQMKHGRKPPGVVIWKENCRVARPAF